MVVKMSVQKVESRDVSKSKSKNSTSSRVEVEVENVENNDLNIFLLISLK